MFSKNNKISKRQIFRLLCFDFLGIGTLLLPSALARFSGRNALISIGIGIVAGLLFTLLLGWVIRGMQENETYPSYLKRCFGKFFGTIVLLVYIVYYLIIGGYTSYVFGHLIMTELLKEQSFYWIVVGILGLSVYAIFQGMEGRARIYEILFCFLLVPLFLMLLLSAKDVTWERMFPLLEQDGRGIMEGSFFSFCVFSLAGFSMFLVPFAKEKEKIAKSCFGAVLFCGGIFLVLHAVVQGTFGTESIMGMEFPAVTLMSTIQIPGGFMERQDALMVAIWFFTVFALLSSTLFYASENMVSLFGGKKRKWFIFLCAIIFFLVGIWCYRSEEFMEDLFGIFLEYATPAIVLIPLIGRGMECIKKSAKKYVTTAVLFVVCMLFCGCSTTELENRNFPLAMGIDLDEKGCMVSYKFQDLSAVADQKAAAESGTDFYIKDKDFYTAVAQYANDSNKQTDYNHLKIVIVSKDFLQDEKSFHTFLEICEKKKLIARSTLLFVAEDAGKILTLDKNLDASIGMYLEELIDSREDYKLKDSVTIGDVINDVANQEQLLLIPVLKEENGLPVIRNYYALSAGEPKGEIDVNDAMLSYLCQGKIRKLLFSLDEQIPVSVNRVSVKQDFHGESKICQVKLSLEVAIEEELDEQNRASEVLEQSISHRFTEQLKECVNRRNKEQQIDLTNSFYQLGKHDKESYELYRDDYFGYLKDIAYSFDVNVDVVN